MSISYIHCQSLRLLGGLRHAREGGNPEGERHGDWMPAFAGMTCSLSWHWCRTYEMDI